MIDYDTLQEGLADYVQAQLGLNPEAVRWVDQNVSDPPQAVRTWATLSMGDLVTQGATDGRATYLTPNPDPDTGIAPADGEEVTVNSSGLRALPFQIQCFSRDTTVGASSARAILSKLLDTLRTRESILELLELGVTLQLPATIRNLTALVNQKFQGRALLETQLQLASSLTSKVGYIKTVNGSFEVDGADAVPFSFTLPNPP